MQYAFQNTDTFSPDRLIAGNTQLVSETCMLASGQNLIRGSVVGRISTSGKMTLSTATATDGSQIPYGVLVDDFNASLADTQCGVYVKGEFNQAALTLGAGQTVAAIHDGLRDAGLFLKPSVPA